MTGYARFGKGVSSLPRKARIAITIPFVAVEAVLVRAFVLTIGEDDPRPAAFQLFLIALVAFVGVPVLREVWRGSAEWRQERVKQAAGERKTAERLAPVHLRDFGSTVDDD